MLTPRQKVIFSASVEKSSGIRFQFVFKGERRTERGRRSSAIVIIASERPEGLNEDAPSTRLSRPRDDRSNEEEVKVVSRRSEALPFANEAGA